jgi:hypothetical protein
VKSISYLGSLERRAFNHDCYGIPARDELGGFRRNSEKFVLVNAYKNETLQMGKTPVALIISWNLVMSKYVVRVRKKCKTSENSVARMVCVVYVQQKIFNH